MTATSKITYIGPSRLLDAEEHFFSELLVTVSHADPGYSIVLDKRDSEVIAHIFPSDSLFRQQTIENLLHFNHNKHSFRIHFSKSLSISKTISFTVY